MTKQVQNLIVFLCLSGILTWAADFKPYPGATVDEKSAAEYRKGMESAPPALKSTEAAFYLTVDSFEKVCAFYKAMARPYQMPGRVGQPRKLASGQQLNEAYFIFDDAQDLASSKLWIKVQRPYVSLDRKDIRDITSIAVTRRK